MAKHAQWHVSDWRAFALAPVVLLVAPVIWAWCRIFSGGAPDRVTAGDVASYIDQFLNGGGGEWDWDDFTSIPLDDPKLEAIRQEADAVPLPINPDGEARLRELLDRARSLAKERR